MWWSGLGCGSGVGVFVRVVVIRVVVELCSMGFGEGVVVIRGMVLMWWGVGVVVGMW